jgi:hypothetical protein
MTDRDLKALEQRTFRTATDDGLWDVLIACVFANLAIAPLLSEDLGDFWSSALLAPIWLAAYLVIWVVRHHIVAPRVGTVRFGSERQQRLRRLGILLLVVNVIAAGFGVVAFVGVQLNWLDLGDGSIAYPLGLAIVVLIGFSGVAAVTGIHRYYLYGLMLAIAPLVGEWLWREGLVTHHGYPIVFGAAAMIIFLTGVVRFTGIVRSHPLPHHTATV